MASIIPAAELESVKLNYSEHHTPASVSSEREPTGPFPEIPKRDPPLVFQIEVQELTKGSWLARKGTSKYYSFM